MPLFDASTLPDDATAIAEANRGIEKLRERLVDEIEVPALPPFMLVHSMTQAFLQGQIRRALMFVEGGYEAYVAHRGLVAFACARAIYETVACVVDFCDTLTTKLAQGNFEDTAKFLHNRHFSARMERFVSNVEGFENKSVNILTLIDKLGKNLPGLKEDYEFLSERTHPNGLGSLHYFWDDDDNDVIKFSTIPKDQGGALQYLILAGRLMFLMDLRISRLEHDVQAFCRREDRRLRRLLSRFRQ
jgi:hypothetical protein